MGLLFTAAVFGAGYTLGRPDGRAQLQGYLTQARELADKPEAKRLRERGREVAGEQAAAVKRRWAARSGGGDITDPAPSDPAARQARRQMRRGWRRPVDTETAATVPGGPAAAAPAVPPTGPAAGFGGTTVAEDSRAVVLGQGTLPPPYRPDTAGPAPTGP